MKRKITELIIIGLLVSIVVFSGCIDEELELSKEDKKKLLDAAEVIEEKIEEASEEAEDTPIQNPVITGIDPSQPNADPNKQWISILGNGFVSDSKVTLHIGSSTYFIPSDRTEYTDSTKIKVKVGLTAGTWTAQVINPEDHLSNIFSFTVIPETSTQINGVKGIDVSAWQGDIDWIQVHDSGYVFAFVKATEGIGYSSSKFKTNMNNGRNAGMLVGAYHFARPVLNKNKAKDEAIYFIEVAKEYFDKDHIRPVLDIENYEDEKNNVYEYLYKELSKEELSNWIHEWISPMKKYY